MIIFIVALGVAGSFFLGFGLGYVFGRAALKTELEIKRLGLFDDADFGA